MSEDRETTDDEVLANDEEFLRTLLCKGQRLPAAADVRTLQERFRMAHVPTYLVRREMVQATTYYFSYTGLPTPNKQVKQLKDARKKADALIRALGDSELDVFIQEDQREIWTEPPGLRKMLYQLLDNADKALAEMQLFATSEKQRTGTGKPEGLRAVIVSLAYTLKWFGVRPQSIYWYKDDPKSYGGEFFEFVSNVCAVCGICLSDHAIHDAIKKLHSNGDLPLIVDTEHP